MMAEPAVLYANGCSMTFGDELVQRRLENTPPHRQYREKHAWPGQLAERLGMPHVVNDAMPGGSNDRIYRATMEMIDSLSHSERGTRFVVIGWSNPNRREFTIRNTNGEPERVRFLLPMLARSELRRRIEQSIGKHAVEMMTLWYEHMMQDIEEQRRTLHRMIMLQSSLRAVKIPHLFFSALGQAHPENPQYDELNDLGNQIDRRRFFGFGNPHGDRRHTFSGFVHRYGYRTAYFGHPMEEGHAAWASMLYAHIRSENLTVLP